MKSLCWLITDAKVGHNLATQVVVQIQRLCPELDIQRRTFYRMRVVENKVDPWIAIIRHPYEIITSGYNYHKICNETWATTKGVHIFDNVIPLASKVFPEANFSRFTPYKEILNNLPVDEGLEYEMRTVAKFTIVAMWQWPYHNYPNVKHIKFEDFYNDFDGTVTAIVKHYGIDDGKIPEILDATRQFNLRLKSREEIMNIDHVTNKELIPFVYKKMWKPKHYAIAEGIFPSDLLTKFGYEK